MLSKVVIVSTGEAELTVLNTGIGKIIIKNATSIQRKAVEHIAPWVLEHLVGKKMAKNIELI